MEFGRAVRGKWLLDKEAVYLNHGSFGATPLAVLEAQTEWRARLEQQPVRFMEKIYTPALREAAGNLAAWIGAQGEDLVFVDNATTGVNAVLRSLKFEPDDEIITTSHVYNAVRQSLRFIADRSGARVVEVPLPFPILSPEMVIEAVAAALTPRTKLAVLDHITSPTALILPIEALVALCQDRGIPVLVDGAHAPGMIPLALEHLGADWYTGNCHKWLCAPKGCAFLWTAPRMQGSTHPTTISHGYDSGYLSEFDWTGTRDPSACLAVTAAIEFRQNLGEAQVRGYNFALASRAARMLAEHWGTILPAPLTMLGAMATVELPPILDPVALHDALWNAHHIEVPVLAFSDKLWVRISAQVYNEFDDYLHLADALEGYRLLPSASA